MKNRLLIAIVLLGAALRVYGISSFPATDAEVAFVGALAVPKSIVGQRIFAALFSLLGLFAFARGFFRYDKRDLAVVGTLLLALDPLSIHAAHTSVRAAMFGVIGVFAVRATLAETRKQRIGEIASAISILVVAWMTRTGSASPDPILAAWSSSSAIAFGAATLHHLGYVLAPIALCAAVRNRRFVIAAIAPVVIAIASARDLRVADLAGIAPAFVMLVAQALATATRLERDANRPRFIAPALVFLILTSNAPVLLSDVLSGLRFPWRQAKTWLDGQRDLDPTRARIFALDPDAARAALGDRFSIERLPIADRSLAGILDRRDDDRERILILPISAGRIHGPDRLGLLEEIEGRKLADFALTARRFDLYRLELRIFRFRATR